MPYKAIFNVGKKQLSRRLKQAAPAPTYLNDELSSDTSNASHQLMEIENFSASLTEDNDREIPLELGSRPESSDSDVHSELNDSRSDKSLCVQMILLRTISREIEQRV